MVICTDWVLVFKIFRPSLNEVSQIRNMGLKVTGVKSTK